MSYFRLTNPQAWKTLIKKITKSRFYINCTQNCLILNSKFLDLINYLDVWIDSSTLLWSRRQFRKRKETSEVVITIMGCFIYILDSSNSSTITFWTNKLSSSSRSNWTGIWTSNSNDSWTDKQSSHFSTAKEMSVKATFFLM